MKRVAGMIVRAVLGAGIGAVVLLLVGQLYGLTGVT